MNQFKPNDDHGNSDLAQSLDIDEIEDAERKSTKPSYRTREQQRRRQRRMNKSLGNLNLLQPREDAEDEQERGQQSLNEPNIPKLVKTSDCAEQTIEHKSETAPAVRTSGPWGPEQIPLAFEEMEPWETPRAKKASLFAYLDETHEGYPVTESGTMIKLTVFFEQYEDNGSRALPPIRQDGTPIKELPDIPTIRSKAENLYLQQFRMMNFDRAVPPQAYQTSMIAEWSDFKVRGVRFSYTDFSNTRVQLPLVKDPEAIREHGKYAVTNAFTFPCHCG